MGSHYSHLSLDERRKLAHWLEVKMPIAEIADRLPADARQAITFDRGTEFSAWKRVTNGIGAEACFCDPQAPYQKGIVENTNNRLRRYLPRTTAPTALTNRYLRSLCQRLNSTRRKCLGYRTPAEVFEGKLMELRNHLE